MKKIITTITLVTLLATFAMGHVTTPMPGKTVTELNCLASSTETVKKQVKILKGDQLKGILHSLAKIEAETKKEATPKPEEEKGFTSIFDGKSLAGWVEKSKGFWRVEEGAIVGGSLEEKVKQNEFILSEKTYADFELRLEAKLEGAGANAGVQFRTEDLPNSNEVKGYQADLGQNWWGCLYDESRRRKVLAGPPKDQRAKNAKINGWNTYRILCEGPRIQMWLNGVKTVDYTEKDENIPQQGIIALQTHGGAKMIARYRNLRIRLLEKEQK